VLLIAITTPFPESIPKRKRERQSDRERERKKRIVDVDGHVWIALRGAHLILLFFNKFF